MLRVRRHPRTTRWWRQQVREHFSYAATWSARWRKPLLLTEFGAWALPGRPLADLEAYLAFVASECTNRDIGRIYYCAGVEHSSFASL